MLSLNLNDPDTVAAAQGHASLLLEKVQAEIDNRFTAKKKYSEVLGACYTLLDMTNKAKLVFACGTFLEFKISQDTHKLQSANFCKDRLCPMCNWRRSLKIYGQVSQVMNVLQNEYDYDFLFLTLTVKNCVAEDLPETVQALLDGWKYLYNKEKEFKKIVQGAFRSLEITRNDKNGTYHPHLHIVLAVKKSYFKGDNYLSQKKWSELWQKACKLDYNPIVHIQKIKTTTEKDMAKAVSEVTKYAVKGSDFLDPNDLEVSAVAVSHFLGALSNRRLCSFTGCFAEVRKRLKLDDVENGDLVLTDNDVIRDDVACMIVRYQWKAGCYVPLVVSN